MPPLEQKTSIERNDDDDNDTDPLIQTQNPTVYPPKWKKVKSFNVIPSNRERVITLQVLKTTKPKINSLFKKFCVKKITKETTTTKKIKCKTKKRKETVVARID